MTKDTIQFDSKLLKELKREYQKAVDENLESFMFHGHEFVTGYAKYLIEYLEMEGL